MIAFRVTQLPFQTGLLYCLSENLAEVLIVTVCVGGLFIGFLIYALDTMHVRIQLKLLPSLS
jgi:hypothetical protein